MRRAATPERAFPEPLAWLAAIGVHLGMALLVAVPF